MCLKFEIWGQIDWKSFFWKIWIKFKGFLKTFYLILMHSIHKTSCFWGVSALKCSVFQKINFFKFSIYRTCCLTDRNCDKKLGLNPPSSIVARLILDQSNVIFDQLNLIFDRLKIIKRVFFKTSFFTCSSLFQTFQKAFLSLFLQLIQIQVKFLSFSFQIFLKFLSYCAGKTFIPFLF